LLYGLLQLDTKILAFIVSIISGVMALFSVIISLWNVNRQRKANFKNDEEKFKRDLSLKSCDEFLERLFSVRELYQKTRTLDSHLTWMLNGSEPPEQDLNEILWSMIENKSPEDLMIYYLKREIVLYKYKEDVERIFQDRDGVFQAIWHYKNFSITGRTDQELLSKIQIVKQRAEPVIELLTNLQRRVQNDFLGKIYNKSLD
jgi:ABC-type antimicrobial peptide transport system permease subunit